MAKKGSPERGQNVQVGKLASGCVYFLFLVALAIGVSFVAMNRLALEENVIIEKPSFFPGFVPKNIEVPPVGVQVAIGLVSFFLLYVIIALVLGFAGVGKENNLDERGWWKRED